MDATMGPARMELVRAAGPAAIVGVGSAVLLFGLDAVALELEHVWWSWLPDAIGVNGEARWWAAIILTLTGVLVGLVLWKAPGHGGHDTATVDLVSPPLPLRALPGVAVALILGLAGGVSLGPEGPIIMIATGLAVVAYRRLQPQVATSAVVMITAAAMLGAMLGTPVAAALVLTGALGGVGQGHLWDRLFAPLVAAGAGTVTYYLLGGPSWDMGLPAYEPAWIDLGTAAIIATVGAVLGAAASAAFAPAHRLFRRLRHPLAYATAGGVLLGVLGFVGGPLTLFKGAHQTVEILEQKDTLAISSLAVILVVKLAAIVIAATSGFRGGRVFPALFAGTTLGVLAHAIAPSVPLTLAVAAGVLGVVFAIARDGWIALFGAALLAGDGTVLPVMCIAILPVWVVLTRAPHMLVPPEPASQP